MRPDALSALDMSRLMQDLATNFGGKKDLSLKTDLWYRHLDRYPLAVVERVVTRLLATDSKYWPTIGQALVIAKELAPGALGEHDSPRARMREWEQDPWATLENLDRDRRDCSSAPCPVCGSIIQFSDRGAVIVHDQQRHREARVSYSNIGRPEWFEMGPPVMPEPKKKLIPQTPNPYTPKEPAPAATPLTDALPAEVTP